MMRALMALSLLAGASTALADVRAFDVAMQPVLAEYLHVHRSLAADRDTGVASAASKIEKLVARIRIDVAGPRAALYREIPRELRAAAAKLRQAKGLEKVREVFKELSRPMARWASLSKPAGVHTVWCSMAKGSWLQREKQIANPYHGSKMLRCGELVPAR
jgi:membrane fusion protein, copper/silver efflux system